MRRVRPVFQVVPWVKPPCCCSSDVVGYRSWWCSRSVVVAGSRVAIAGHGGRSTISESLRRRVRGILPDAVQSRSPRILCQRRSQTLVLRLQVFRHLPILYFVKKLKPYKFFMASHLRTTECNRRPIKCDTILLAADISEHNRLNLSQ